MDTDAAAAAAAAEDDRKLFVGGLPQGAKDTDIKTHFEQYGEVESVNLKTDAATGRSRGFAFVVFVTEASCDAAVAAGTHNLQGKDVAVKKAQAKQGKIYVGKLKAELTDEAIKEFFGQYGSIATVEQPFDKVKNERKNFCFITFDKEDTAKKLLKEGSVHISGHELEIKKVNPPNKGMQGGFGGGRGGGRGGFQGGFGGPGGYGGYGDAYGGWGGYGGPAAAYGGYGGWDGGYGGYGGGYGGGQWGGYGGAAGGKARGGPRGGARGGARGAGAGRGGQRTKPY